MAAVLERTGYIAIGGREKTKRSISLDRALHDSAQGARLALAALAAEIALSAEGVSLMQSTVLILTMLIGILFCFSIQKAAIPFHVRLYKVGIGIALGVIAGIVLQGISKVSGFEMVVSLPLAVMTIGGLIAATRLGRYAISE